MLRRRAFMASPLILTAAATATFAREPRHLAAAETRPRPRTILAAIPISRMDQAGWRRRFEEKQDRLRSSRVDLAFYGDSIMHYWETDGPEEWHHFRPLWDRYYGDRNVVNLGFTGDTTANLLWRLENGEATGIAPKLAVVLIGANNLGYLHWSTQDTLAGMDAIMTQLRTRLPHTKLLLLGILPSERTEWATQTTREVNSALATRYASDQAVTYLDVGHVLMKNGKLDRSLYLDPQLPKPADPLHPSARGAALIFSAMEPTVARLMGDRVHAG
jgi:lysophospholipase L1-like esterase